MFDQVVRLLVFHLYDPSLIPRLAVVISDLSLFQMLQVLSHVMSQGFSLGMYLFFPLYIMVKLIIILE